MRKKREGTFPQKWKGEVLAYRNFTQHVLPPQVFERVSVSVTATPSCLIFTSTASTEQTAKRRSSDTL